MTPTTEQLVLEWIRTRTASERLAAQLTAAEAQELNAANALGKWLCPEGAAIKEVFNVWIGSGVLQAQIINDQHDYAVKWRKEPDGKDRFEQGF